MIATRVPKVRYLQDQDFSLTFVGDAVCLVRPGDNVTPTTQILEGEGSEILQSLNISRELGIPPEQIKKFLLRDDGEIIEQGAEIAKKTVSMGMAEKVVKATVDGCLSFDRVDSGVVDIMSPFSDVSVTAGLNGKVKAVLPARDFRREVIFTVNVYQTRPFTCEGESISGDLHVIKEGNSMYMPTEVGRECKGKIVVAGRFLSAKLYDALVEAGAIGVIAGGADYLEFASIQSKAVAVFITEGWGVVPINNVLIDILTDDKSERVFLNVKEKKMMLLPDIEGGEVELSQNIGEFVPPVEVVDVEEGQIVQVWDQPYWGYSGVVVSKFDMEELVQVKFQSGNKVVLPASSITVIS